MAKLTIQRIRLVSKLERDDLFRDIPPAFDFIDAYYMIITSMMSRKTKDGYRNGKLTTELHQLASHSFTLVCALVLATTLTIVIGSGNVYAEYTKEQYCKEQEEKGQHPFICKSAKEQEEAIIMDGNNKQEQKKSNDEWLAAKKAHEQNNQNNNNQNQNSGNSNGGSNGGGGGSGGGSTCGTAHTFFDWGCNGADDKDSILTVLVTISNWLAAGVVIAVIGGIIYGAIMYATSAGDAAKAKSATEIIRNAFIALVLYFLMWAFLQYIVPGGLFN